MKKRKQSFSVYTQPIIDEAIRRGIKVKGFGNTLQSYAHLQFGKHEEFIKRAGTNRTGYATGEIFRDKYLSTLILKQLDLKVPQTLLSDSETEIAAFLKKHKMIVIKPNDSYGGKGVTVNITQRKQIAPAIKEALKYSQRKKHVLVQKQVKGEDCRVLVINKKHLFAIKRVPAHIIGDGEHTVEQLIEEWNKQVPVANRKIKLQIEAKRLLRAQKLTPKKIPALGQVVQLGVLANSHKGGISVDMTTKLAPEVKRVSKRLAKYFDADVLGVDFFSSDITKRPGYIIELAADPGLTIHHNPTIGKPRNVAAKIVDMLFPETIK